MDTKLVPADAIVLDLGDETVRRFMQSHKSPDSRMACSHGRDLCDLIEAQIPKPKPAEPTEFGAMVKDRDGVLWVRNCTEGSGVHNPWCSAGGDVAPYIHIDAVEVIWGGAS